MNRRSFLARLVAAPIVALAVLRAPVRELEPPAMLDDRQTGISIRFIQQYDIEVDQHPTRIDWAWEAIEPA